MNRKLLALFTALFIGFSGIALVYSTSIQATGRHEQEEVKTVSTATFAIENMTCASCPISVKKVMTRVDGVKDVNIDFAAKTATVEFDPALVSAQAIADASSNIGYPASPVE